MGHRPLKVSVSIYHNKTAEVYTRVGLEPVGNSYYASLFILLVLAQLINHIMLTIELCVWLIFAIYSKLMVYKSYHLWNTVDEI